MKTVLITGDSRGVGLSICKTILENSNHRVVGVSRYVNNELVQLEELYPDRFIHVVFDLSRPSEIKEFYLDKLKKYGPFISYINNAAIAYDDIITNLNFNSLEIMYKVNVFSPMILTKYMIRDMILHKNKGSIIHISSISAHTGYKGLAMYASTKGALEAFSLNTAREWGGIGIRSNCVCPGFMNTEMSSSLTIDQKDKIYKRNSLKKEVEIDSVASTVLFLLSDGASSITGHVLNVDCGTI